MTIKSNGGIFGRNPTFNNVTVDGILTVDQIVEKTSASGITLDGVTLKDGNVVLASGKGIDFSATAGTGTSELFDDYEEGTWTPEITAGISGVGYASRAGFYTKIGNLVTISGQISTNAGTATSSQITITGLPFSVVQIGGAFFTYLNTGVAASLWIAAGAMYGYKATGANLNGTDLGNAANTIVYFTGQYTAS